VAARDARAAISNTGWHPQRADNRFMSADPKQPADTAAPFDPASAGWQRHAVDGFLDLVGISSWRNDHEKA